jgi:FkbM family methyltransferase
MNVEKIYLAARKRVLTLLKGRYFVASKRHGLFLVDMNDHVSRQVEAFGLYEPRQIEYFSQLSRDLECDAFLDVGANLGLYSIYFSRYFAIEVIAFEPDTRVRNQLSANLFLNGMDDLVRVEPVALSSKSGTLNFERFDDQNRGRSRVSAQGSALVTSARLDDLIDWSGRRVAVKVDIEGHEQHLLKGAGEFLQRNKVLIQMEMIEGREDTVALLRGLGFENIHRIGHDFYFHNMGAS